VQEQLIEQLAALLQEKVGLSSDQTQQAIEVATTFAKEHSGEIIQSYGPQIIEQFGPQIMEQLGPQLGQLLGGGAGGLLGGLFGGSR
jgi:hypothetical protein